MTIDKDRSVKIPIWIIAFIAPLLVGGISGYAASRFQDGKITNQLEINTRTLDTKVSKDSFELFSKQLDRIENKLDNQETRIDALIK